MTAPVTDAALVASIALDFAHTAQSIDRRRLEIAELLGISEYITTKLEKLAMATDHEKAKLAELTTKLKAYEAQVAASKTAEDEALASAQATVAANQAVVDSLNAKISTLTAQIAAGEDTSDVLADIQSDIDSIPLDPVAAPPATPGVDSSAASTSDTPATTGS